MSPLILIKRSIQRKQRLNEAQFLMAKAYRGVSYSSSGDSTPKISSSAKTYRGVKYSA
jgi:hypothetical protein